MAIKVGDYYAVKTKTINDRFGDVVYKCVKKIKIERKYAEAEDGFEFEMQGGSGELARSGYVIQDTVANMEKNIKDGIAKKVTADYSAGITKATTPDRKNSMLGIEID